MKRLAILVCVLVSSLLVARLFYVRANPEVSFWAECLDRKGAELARLQKEAGGGPVVIFTGGSSCAFSIDPGVIDRIDGTRSYNMGGPVAMGAPYLISNALCQARRGDVVVLALERQPLVDKGGSGTTQIGMALAAKRGDINAAAGAPVFNGTVTWREQLVMLRPGGRYIATYLGKKMFRRPGYAYSMADFRPGGRLETANLDRSLKPEGLLPDDSLTGPARSLLQAANAYARKHGIRICYALPWMLTDPGVAARNRGINAKLLAEIAGIVPVLADDSLGVATDPSLFSDTRYHLTTPGAAARSRVVANGLDAFLKSGSDH